MIKLDPFDPVSSLVMTIMDWCPVWLLPKWRKAAWADFAGDRCAAELRLESGGFTDVRLFEL